MAGMRQSARSTAALASFAAILFTGLTALAADETRGWLVIEGGSAPLNPVVAEKFRELIGGADEKVLFSPTALDDDQVQREIQSGSLQKAAKEHMGLRNYEIFNTHDRKLADSKEFATKIRSARGIWFGGGRPGRIAEAYLGTETQRELQSFYRNGGVIGGSSAGAMIQSSFLVRGGVDNEDFSRFISKKNREGFGFLPNAAIDVHVNQRHGEDDLGEVLAAHPELLCIGLDAGTAIVVHGNQFEVIGGSNARVIITDGKEHDGKSYYFLKRGDRFDLVRRVAIEGQPNRP
jgi:cyanophycinase